MADPPALYVALADLDRAALPLAGGKAANLGELCRADGNVPPGFCVTTDAYAQVEAGAGLQPLLEALAALGPDEAARMGELAAAARDALLAAPVPPEVERAVHSATEALGAGAPLAVRSSATAEDLPFASFAGQQETFLNVVGHEAVLAAVRRCWASLWTDRAVAYRAAAGVDPRRVRLAVVIQRLVDARVAGVLFTADPVTGNREHSVIDASPGLGEAVVSGAVNPDHFVVETASGAVVQRRLGDRRTVILPERGGGTRRVSMAAPAAACVSDALLADLAAVGARVQAHFGVPQDMEFAVDGEGALWLLQARPITTLYPLPAGNPADLRVYWSLSVMQGVFRPLTPMGVQAFRLLASSFAGLVATIPPEPPAGPPALKEAAGRLFLDITPILRSPAGRTAARALDQVEAESGRIIRRLLDDPRLAPRPRGPVDAGLVVRILSRTRLPVRVLAAIRRPEAARRDARRLRARIDAEAAVPPGATALDRLDLAQRLLLSWPPRLLPLFAAPLIAGLGALALGERLAGAAAGDALRRGLPHNPTTEMDLTLWELACEVRQDQPSVAALRERSPADLSAAYRSGGLPPVLGRSLAAFLGRYGHRGVGEIDIGLPRWSEDPAPVLASLANYVLRWDPARAPDAQFRAAAAEAGAAKANLIRRADPARAWAVRFLLGRGRELAGLREMPKFTVVYLLARVRTLLLEVGASAAARGALAGAEDIFFLDLAEARAAVAGTDMRAVVRERRAAYGRERRRHHVPRVLLSDGTDAGALATEAPPTGALRGTPASAGHVRGRARVVLDPAGAVLEPGEILVAPSTDPGWTPLFLTAGGLVMEMGGAMSHGAVVAREYGIPAVVGVLDATRRIRGGDRIAVDGTVGVVTVEGRAGGA